MPLLFLILLFLGVYAELTVIINVGEEIGAGGVLLAMIGTAVIGVWLVRLQGFDVYRKINKATAEGKAPVAEMLHGFLLLFAGFLLIIPGFISDALGAILLIPPVRQLIINKGFWKYLRPFEYSQSRRGPGGGVIIEGEFTAEEDENESAPKSGQKRLKRD